MNSATVVKREKRTAPPATETQEDKDIAEWAQRLAARPSPQIGTANPGGSGYGQTTLNSFFSVQSATGTVAPVNPEAPGIPANQGFDLDSAIGRFTWHTISEDKYVPCIFRNGEKYCCIRMTEISVICDLIRLLPSELYDCVDIESHTVTTVEARLLTHINSWHCDGFYGNEIFTTKDFVVRLEDAERFYNYLNFAYAVLSTGGRNDAKDYSKCGFLRVNNDNLIPYTVLSPEEKGVPLFYFEGHTDVLKQQAVPLSGWELAYLKVCCKVQGVRKDLISGNSLQIIKLSELRAKFPKKTIFTEECWPSPKPKSLLPKSNTNGVNAGYQGSNTAAAPPPPTGSQWEKWSRCIPYKNENIVTNTNGPSQFPTTASSSATSTQHAASLPTPTPPSRTSTNSAAAPVPNHLNNSAPSHQRPPAPVPSRAQPPTLPQVQAHPHAATTTSTNAIQNHSNAVINNKNGGMAMSINNLTVRVANGIPQIPSGLQANSAALTKIRVVSPPQDTSRLQIIPENNDPYNRESAYTVRLIIIDKELMHCINFKPLRNEEYLLVLQEFMNTFFPSVSIYPTAVSVLKSCGVSTFLPNTHQIRTLNNFGFNIQHNWQIPLIPAVDVTRVMNKLKTVFRPRNAISSEAVINHAARNGYSVLSNSR